MSDAKQRIRLWKLLVRVRRLRVERKRRVLTDARRAAQAADDDASQRRAALQQHDVQRDRILQSCGHDRQAARLWREALRWHDMRKQALHRALVGAMQRQMAAAEEVSRASASLQREMIGQQDAEKRVRSLNAALRDD